MHRTVKVANKVLEAANQALAARGRKAIVEAAHLMHQLLERLHDGDQQRAEADRAERGGARALERARGRVGGHLVRRQKVPGGKRAGDRHMHNVLEDLAAPVERDEQRKDGKVKIAVGLRAPDGMFLNGIRKEKEKTQVSE